MINPTFKKSIEKASQVIGKTWPLYSFVTSNPLSGYEKMSFENAVKQGQQNLNANMFPKTNMFREAFKKGDIKKEVIVNLLKENHLFDTPETYLDQMESFKMDYAKNSNHDLDRIMAKWLAAFLDEGLAEWTMPNKNEGFYKAWRKLAIYDNDIPKLALKEIPTTSAEALDDVLHGYSEEDITKICTFHLAALPGWTGYINYRNASNSQWQQEYPITLEDYLAVRLWIAKKTDAKIFPETNVYSENSSAFKLQYIWLKAWEKSWQKELVKLFKQTQMNYKTEKEVPDAQMVFCIDTRSELIRRHIEQKGHYETFGYAGFFGIAMDYESLHDGLTRKSCPPILNSAYHVTETSQQNKHTQVTSLKQKSATLKFKDYFLKRLKNMLPSAFGYVEGSGVLYGLSLITRTLLPGYFYKIKRKHTLNHESICEPKIEYGSTNDSDTHNISLDEKVAIVKSAFDLMGWKDFAPIVLFIGHGSHSANNPFSSSLDCGACAASPGRHNARMLAKLANLTEVKDALCKKHGIYIPMTTIFIGGEHNTTTDEILLFDSQVPDTHKITLEKLKLNLVKAQETATKERLGTTKNNIALAYKKANDWGETRPEWGLAKNSGFIVGPRELTKNKNLNGRCFLHSYNWETDQNGKALEAIMQGPMVVTQWINNHYYFSTVDNDAFGSGSKITHNITGKFGVVQGNGGDLKMGLPLQSVMQSDQEMYHQPLRLSVIIQAPLSRVNDILLRNEHLKNLIDNEWIYLMVTNPLEENTIYAYEKNHHWRPTKSIKGYKKSKIESIDEVLV